MWDKNIRLILQTFYLCIHGRDLLNRSHIHLLHNPHIWIPEKKCIKIEIYIYRLDIFFHQITTFIKVHVALVFGLQTHSSEIKGSWSTLKPREMLQNLLCLWKKKTHVVFFIFHLEQLFTLWMPWSMSTWSIENKKITIRLALFRKKKLSDKLFPPTKCFKICHIYRKWKPM